MRIPNQRTGFAVAAILLALTGCEKATQTDISTIIARHTEARGGAAALEAVKAIEVDRRVQEGKRQFTTHYVAIRDGRMRLDVYQSGSLVLSEGNDGESAWQRRGNLETTADMPDWALTAVKRAVRHNLYALHELAALGTELKLDDREKYDGLLHWVIVATDRDGYERRLFISPNDYLITRVQEYSALNPDRTNYPTDLNTYFSDFREVDGVIFSFKSETHGSESGVALQTTEATEIVVNPEIVESIFSRPADNDGQRGESS